MTSTREMLQVEVHRLRRFAFSLTANAPDADDLVHDVIVKALEKGIPDLGNPVPWLITLCKNTWIDQIRYRKVRRHTELDEMGPEEEARPGHSVEQLHAQRVLEGLQHLSEDHRVALSLVAIEGLSYAETAEVLGVPLGTVMSRVARAREHLLKAFGNSAEVEP